MLKGLVGVDLRQAWRCLPYPTHGAPAVTMLTETRLPTLITDEYGQAMACELGSVMLMTPTVDPECGGGQLAAPEERGGVKERHYADGVTKLTSLVCTNPVAKSE